MTSKAATAKLLAVSLVLFMGFTCVEQTFYFFGETLAPKLPEVKQVSLFAVLHVFYFLCVHTFHFVRLFTFAQGANGAFTLLSLRGGNIQV